jgi:hypothetical protein
MERNCPDGSNPGGDDLPRRRLRRRLPLGGRSSPPCSVDMIEFSFFVPKKLIGLYPSEGLFWDEEGDNRLSTEHHSYLPPSPSVSGNATTGPSSVW